MNAHMGGGSAGQFWKPAGNVRISIPESSEDKMRVGQKERVTGPGDVNDSLSLIGGQLDQAALWRVSSFPLALAHAADVNDLIWVILAAGKRVNKSLR
jgi:hypothetical protein